MYLNGGKETSSEDGSPLNAQKQQSYKYAQRQIFRKPFASLTVPKNEEVTLET